MHASSARTPAYAAGLTVILAATLAACGSSSGSGSSASGGSSSGGGSSATAATPLDAVRLAAKTSHGASSFTGTMSLRATVKTAAAGSASRGTSLNATFTEQLRPALLAQVNIASISAAGTSLPGGMTEIITPSKLYLKWSYLTTLLHTTKPWIAIGVSSLSKTSGVNLSQIFSQASSSSPLTDSQLLGGATAVRKVGPETLDGVAVTKYTGKLSLDKGIKYLSAGSRSTVQKAFNAAGMSTATFTVWIDGQNTVRKAIVSEIGTSVTEIITTTITSIDQPVKVSIPAAGQTGSLPGGSH